MCANVGWVLKVCLLGEAGVGKTSLLYRYMEDKFRTDFKSTLGVNLLKKTVKIDDKNIAAQVWDLGGQDSFKKLRKLYLEGADGALVVFDVTNQESFDKLDDWVSIFREVHGSKPLILIGNKIDLEDRIKIKPKNAEKYAKDNKMRLILTSAKTGENVENAFVDLISTVIKIKESDTLFFNT
jgi:small GTP-binding protein